MMGRQTVDQSQLFYLFNLEEQIPADHLLRRLNPIVTRVLMALLGKGTANTLTASTPRRRLRSSASSAHCSKCSVLA